MAEILYNGVPANVTFANTLTVEAINDPGAEIRGVDHKDNTIKVQLFQLNSYVALATGDTLTIKVETSEEVAYYKNLEKSIKGLTVTAEAIEG